MMQKWGGGEMGDKQCATPMGHSCPTKSKWTSPRDCTWTFPPRESGPLLGRACQHGSRVTTVPGHPLHCPRHCLLQKYTSLANQNMLVTAFLRGKLFSKKNAYHAHENVFLSC